MRNSLQTSDFRRTSTPFLSIPSPLHPGPNQNNQTNLDSAKPPVISTLQPYFLALTTGHSAIFPPIHPGNASTLPCAIRLPHETSAPSRLLPYQSISNPNKSDKVESMQVQRSPEVHDVVVIGSGAGGGTTVKVLTDLGINVTLLEAGPMLDPMKDFKEHVWPWQVDHRGSGDHAESYFGKQQWSYWSAPNGYWDVPGEPYSIAPGEEFRWFRSRILGGRTNHYGRISLRFSDYDFKPQAFDGLGFDWPVTYEEMSPWYDKAEGFMGVTGTHEGIRSAPDGNFLPPVPPRVHEMLVQRAGKKLNIPVIPSRMAMLTKGINGRRRLPLLRTMWTRLPHRLGIHIQPGHDFPGDENRQTQNHHGRHGSRTHRE